MSMKWETKAKIMRVCDRLPYSNLVYKFLQKRFGRLDGNPWSRLLAQREIADWIFQESKSIEGKVIFEIGTGHLPVVPIGFFLMGASKTITIDLNRRVDMYLLRDALKWISEHKQQVTELYQNVVIDELLSQRLLLIEEYINKPNEFMVAANIEYIAPGDATKTGLNDQSIDYHISNTVLEHIDKPTIKKIMSEAIRIMRSDALAIHFIDLSDHFQHQDDKISKVNFLKYAEKDWMRMAGNQFAYCNRLRHLDYIELFSSGFKTLRIEQEIDSDSLAVLNSKHLLVDPLFQGYGNQDLSCTTLSVCLSKS
jgi:ubiquinone/menaquinone biosynthesis C-methylase UbiE